MLAEVKVYFTVPLAQQLVLEQQPVTFMCKTSKPNVDVLWFKEDTIIDAGHERYVLESHGDTHTLSIPEAHLVDRGDFIATVGEEVTTAELVVNGEGDVWVEMVHDAFQQKSQAFVFRIATMLELTFSPGAKGNRSENNF